MFLRKQNQGGKPGGWILGSIFLVAFLACIFYFSDVIFAQEQVKTIVIKIMGVNPSKEQGQKLTIKTHLPKEVTPEDVLDKGDLEISYDTEKSAYYVYGEYELGPEETIEREVEIRNIWQIPVREIESLRIKSAETVELLENTEFKEKADFLRNSIEAKLSEIKITAINPQKHISNFRDNVALLEAAKRDLMLSRAFVSQVKVLPTLTIWKLFFIVVIVLLVLAASFYFFWLKQSKGATPIVIGGAAKDDITLKQHTEEEQIEVSADDIEKLMDDQ